MLNLAIDHYLAVRRAAGFQLKVQEGLLRHFARYNPAQLRPGKFRPPDKLIASLRG